MLTVGFALSSRLEQSCWSFQFFQFVYSIIPNLYNFDNNQIVSVRVTMTFTMPDIFFRCQG